MKQLTIAEENAIAKELAESPTKSNSHMGTEERQEAILVMLRDLEQLARKDGCVAAAWALEYVVDQVIDGQCEACGKLLFEADDFVVHSEGYDLCRECVGALT